MAVTDGNISALCNIPEEQYIETNVMHFPFYLLKMTGLYKFRALLAHPQEVLHSSNTGSSQLT
jgi:hypothetical protein